MEIPRIVLIIVILIISAGLIIYFAREFLGSLLAEGGPVLGLFEESKSLTEQLTGELVKTFK